MPRDAKTKAGNQTSNDGFDAPHMGEDPDALGNVGHPVAGSAKLPRNARELESDEDMA